MAPVKLPDTLDEAHALIVRLVERIQEMEAEIAELKRRLGQTSQNSSKPPSSDPPFVKRPPKKEPSGRKPGGQPGHEGNHRELVPPEKVDEAVDHWPTRCGNCQGELPTDPRVEVDKPIRHQVTELPEVVAHVTEHRLHLQVCPRCEWATAADWPEGVPKSNFGPRLQAVVSVMTGCHRMPRRTALEVVEDVFHAPMALGSVAACEQTVSRAVAPAVEEARVHVQKEAVGYADETGWRERRKKAWLWIFATAFVVVFLIHRRRNREAARQLLGAFRGTLVSDRWSAYAIYKGLRQICWAHLSRDFQALSECKGKVGRIGRKLVRLTRRMFGWWYRVRDGTMSRQMFQRKMRPLRRQVERLLAQGVTSGVPGVAGLCWDIVGKHGDALWTFVDVEGVEPTNNNAERPLRHAVMWRKSSMGTHSEAGSRFAERMLTVRATLRAQGRNVIGYVTQAVEASLRGLAVPSLLPDDQPAALPLAA